jgi:glycosyltransferase involved in cell wall biosynthesis
VLAERLLARFTDRIIAVSESVKRDLVDRYRVCGEGKVSVLPLGLDFGWVGSLADRDHLREAPGVSPGALVIGIVGRLTEVKNQGLLFSSLRLVGRDNMRVLVFGDGERRASLEQLVQDLELGESVIFVGWQRDPARIYAGLDIVCLTSRNEGTPVALIEAMAAGCTVVSTRVGGVPDLMVGEGTIHEDGFEVFANGILVPADDPPALAAALRLLADRPDLRRAMGTAGQASVLDRFSKERMLEGMERVYAALVDGRNEGVACEH